MRKHVIEQAVGSYFELSRVIDSMTEKEILAALDLECASQRRKSTMCRLLKKAVRLNEISYKENLIRKFFDGKKSICNND